MWASYAFGLVTLGLAFAGAYIWYQSQRVNREHRAMAEGLVAAVRRDGYHPIAASQFEGLPPPVRRYLGLVIGEGLPRAHCVRLTQTGLFRTREEPERWQPFRAIQHVATSPPGFVWDATVRMAPLLAVRVVDSYREGAGLLCANLLGVFTVAESSGPETDSGEMIRYLSEAIWYPTALVPDERLRWQAVDERSAVAVLKDGGREVAVKFCFDEAGLVCCVEAERYRIEKSGSRKLAWRAYCAEYQSRGGFLIPLEARVAWVLPEGELEYFRGRIDSITYDC